MLMLYCKWQLIYRSEPSGGASLDERMILGSLHVLGKGVRKNL